MEFKKGLNHMGLIEGLKDFVAQVSGSIDTAFSVSKTDEASIFNSMVPDEKSLFDNLNGQDELGIVNDYLKALEDIEDIDEGKETSEFDDLLFNDE